MRKFICSPFGEEVDLDDPKTYKCLPNNVNDLRTLMLKEIGYYYCYTKFWHKDTFGKDNKQKKKVKKLIKNFTENESKNYENVLWYQEQIFLFQDEIENMC